MKIKIGYISLAIAMFLTTGLWAQTLSNFDYTKKQLLNPQDNIVLVAAHRGPHNKLPENSIACIQKAIALGVDIIEIDVRVTKDGIAVLMHDDTVDRTTNGTGEVEKMEFNALKKLRLLDADKMVTEETIPTLDKVLQLTKNKIMIDLDLKVNVKSLKKIIAIVKKHKAEDYLFFFDSEYRIIKKLNREYPESRIMTKLYNNSKHKKSYTVLQPDYIHLASEEENCSPEFIAMLKSNYGRPIFINALGDIDKLVTKDIKAYDVLIAKGVHIIQTDYPELLLNYLRKTGKHQ